MQFVNESNATILVGANAAHVGTSPALNALPREGSWTMQPFGTKAVWPDGTPQNTLTLDIPPQWENTKVGGSVGPVFWPRTGCKFDPINGIDKSGLNPGVAQCETGNCGGDYDCSNFRNASGIVLGETAAGPKALVEWIFNDLTNHNITGVDISFVDGANINADLYTLDGSPTPQFGFNASTWLGPANSPLMVCGQDPRAPGNCPIANFQLTRHLLSTFAHGTPGGDDVVGCFSNCGRYKYQGSTAEGGKACAKEFRCPGEPAQTCNTDDPGCRNWMTFCCAADPAVGGPDVYGVAPTFKPCGTDKSCDTPGIKGTDPILAKCWNNGGPQGAVCSCVAFIKNETCPESVCTNGNAAANTNQPPFLRCSGLTSKSDACIGEDTIHEFAPRALTWPNDPETYFSDGRIFRVVFAPGAFVNGASVPPITNSAPPPLCDDLPAAYHPKAQRERCAPFIQQGARFAGARRPGDNPLLPNGEWDCVIAGRAPDGNIAGKDTNGVLCAW